MPYFCAMKLYVIAGEASGDLHGSNLIKALKRQRAGLECRAWGGDLMLEAGAEVVKHYRDLAFMGFVEVLKNLRTILGNLDFCKKDILAYRPDALVLIDYPGFNLRIAKWAKKQGIRVLYYISPQVWAWHKSRVHDIRRDVDAMLVILPFEQAFYKDYGVETQFVGHPLLDALQGVVQKVSEGKASRQVTLLPGSRKQEIQKILPAMLAASQHFPQFDFVIAAASGMSDEFLRPYLAKFPEVKVQRGNTYMQLKKSRAALVKSGTSTLETALIGVPQVVCYAGNPISYVIAKSLVTIKYISLVNLVLDRPLVKELIQGELTEANVATALRHILEEGSADELREGYTELRQKLGGPGASARAAAAIIKMIEK
jgi:lipid-A-disaccharide synthase